MEKLKWQIILVLFVALTACSGPVGKKIELSNVVAKNEAYNVVYPQVVKAGPDNVRSKVNALIKNQAFDLMSGGEGYEKLDLFSTYEATLNNYPFLSLRFDESLSFYHMAHPENAIRSLTVNVSNGEVYLLDDLFVPGSDHRGRLSQIVKDILQLSGIRLLNEFGSIEKGQGFYLTDDSLVLYWQEYVYTTHAQGPLVVSVPAAMLKDILNKKMLLCLYPKNSPLFFFSDALNNSILTCPESVWPNYSWQGLQILLLDNEHQKANFWNKCAESSEIELLTEAEYNRIPPGLLTESWSSDKWDNCKTLSIAMAAAKKENTGRLELLGHEAFHIMGQNNWVRGSIDARGDLYPENWQPRYYRRQIMRSLYNAFVGDDQKAAGRAIFWQNKFKNEFPDEAARCNYIDRIEGSAEFAGLLTAALGLSQSQKMDQKIYSFLVERVKARWKEKWDNFNRPASLKEGESYAIGCLAGLILEKQNIAGWKEKVAGGETPMDILADNVTAVQDSDNKYLKSKVKLYYEQKNEDIKKAIDSFTKAKIYLAVPLNWMSGGFERQGFVDFVDRGKKRTLILGMSAEFISPSKGTSLKINFKNAEMVQQPYPLGGFGYFVFAVGPEKPERDSNGTYSLESQGINAHGLTLEKQTAANAVWLWLK